MFLRAFQDFPLFKFRVMSLEPAHDCLAIKYDIV